MADGANIRTVEKLLRQQAALAAFGSFAFREVDLQKILEEAARICADSLEVPFCKICRYRPAENDLLIEAGCGWEAGVVGGVVSQANETSPQGRAYVTGQPVIIRNLQASNNLALPAFYPVHGIVSTVDVLIPAIDGTAYGVLEVDSTTEHQYDVHDINFLTGFANVLAEAVASAKKNQALRAVIDEKNLLAEEMQHRVRNNLQMLHAMLETYAHGLPNDPGREGIDAISRRVMTLAQVYDSLVGVGLSHVMDLTGYLCKLCESLPTLVITNGAQIDMICNGDELMLDLDDVTTLGIIVAELVTNSYEHAFADGDGTIDVRLTYVAGAGTAAIAIRDDGSGFVEKPLTTRRGLGLVRRLVGKLDGTLTVTSVGGTQWTLTFPVAPPSLAMPVGRRPVTPA